MAIPHNKLDYETVKSFIEENSECEVLSKEYEHARAKMLFKCKCGERFETTFSKFKSRNKRRCNKCSGVERLTFDKLNKLCKSLELKHFQTGELSAKEKVLFETKESYKIYTTYEYLKNASNLPVFQISNPYSFENVLLFVKMNSDHECLSNKYKGWNGKLLMKCPNPKHQHYEITFNDFQQGRRCPFCKFDKISKRMTLNNPMEGVKGELHPNFNPLLTNDERENVRETQEYKEFKVKVRKRDMYKCRCCGKRALIVHHLNGYHWCKEQRNDVGNAVTLCSCCHTEFHKIYGQKNNTKEQFEEYIKTLNTQPV